MKLNLLEGETLAVEVDETNQQNTTVVHNFFYYMHYIALWNITIDISHPRDIEIK